jgi:homogentisate 1,2-dioxygenase
MPPYHSLGQVPPKRHTQFRKPDGGLYSEELVSTEGFSDDYSIAYHVHPPTRVRAIGASISVKPQVAIAENMQHRCLRGFQTAPAPDYLSSRTIALCNDDVQLYFAAPQGWAGPGQADYFFKNAQADELIFVHEGSGHLLTAFGEVPFAYGDYLHIPRGVIYKLRFDGPDNRLFITESFSPIHFPKRYLSKYGQLMEHAPFCERDLVRPAGLVTHDAEGDYHVVIKKQHQHWPYTYASHPFDYIGWDGCFYPYAFSIHNFEPITGRLHQPPPVHQTFEAHNFVVCSFVPRLFDYHPLSIPAPYNHSNVDSDEVLYYVDGDFMSRKHVERGMITLHPMGIPHGPHPGTVEKSIGAKETKELAVMVDTFRPLRLTQAALDVEMQDYYLSWL